MVVFFYYAEFGGAGTSSPCWGMRHLCPACCFEWQSLC